MTRGAWIWGSAIATLALSASPSLAEPPQGGTISIATQASGDDAAAIKAAFGEGLSDALAARGFTILDDGHAAYVADVTLTETDVGTGAARVPTGSASIQPGMSAGSGVGVAVPLGTGKSTFTPLLRTVLDVRIHKRDDATVLWHGAAVTIRQAGTRKGAANVIATDLSQAVLASYPGEPAEMVGVP